MPVQENCLCLVRELLVTEDEVSNNAGSVSGDGGGQMASQGAAAASPKRSTLLALLRAGNGQPGMAYALAQLDDVYEVLSAYPVLHEGENVDLALLDQLRDTIVARLAR
jgi:hypothetical protein